MVVKAFCHLRNAPCTFVINRIKNGWPLKETFKPDHKIIDSVTLDNTVSYKKARDVMIRLTGDAVKFAKANQMHSKQKITKIRDGSFLFSIPEVPAEVVVPWILSQKDEAVPLEPPEIVEASRKGAQAIADRTSWRQPARLILLSAQTVDAVRFRRDPQVFRTRQAGSRQEFRRCRRKFLRQCRLDANAQEKNKDGKDFRHGRYNDLKKNYLELTFKSF